LETLLETTKSTSITMPNSTLENVLTYLQVMQTKVNLLQMQFQLLNDKLRTLKNQGLVKNYELVFVQNNPLYEINPPQHVVQGSQIVDDESQDAKAQSDTKSNLSESDLESFSFEVTKENIHECLKENKQEKNDLSKSIVRPWEELNSTGINMA
jgi:hypothetical protein